ncbi:hypothetical protein ANACOL_00707 [Anaerotruncus colihominis DSM 17241]|uniref:Uncharacterized protein n=1 Tax=Anaerotruncus colihominis DSM 17241 TaxID=445972 RepID=B0P7H6_9FIRM|nr:hypothetical protein ANACOL_00707 [Anaerotruncus colihominis DSM 17241]
MIIKVHQGVVLCLKNMNKSRFCSPGFKQWLKPESYSEKLQHNMDQQINMQ